MNEEPVYLGEEEKIYMAFGAFVSGVMDTYLKGTSSPENVVLAILLGAELTGLKLEEPK